MGRDSDSRDAVITFPNNYPRSNEKGVLAEYEKAVLDALAALDTASENGTFPAELSSSLRGQLEGELHAVREGRLSPRSLAAALSHQMVDSGCIDDGFSAALDTMIAAEASAPGEPTLVRRVTVRQLGETGVRTMDAAGPLLGRYGLLLPVMNSQDGTRLITIEIEGSSALPAFSSRELFDEWASGATESGVSAAFVPAGGIGRLAPGVDVVINPLNERLVLAAERTGEDLTDVRQRTGR